MAFETTPSLGAENLVGSTSQTRVSCTYREVAPAGQVFIRDFYYLVQQDGSINVPGGQSATISNAAVSAFDGGITTGCPVFTDGNGHDYTVLSQTTDQSGNGLQELPIVTWAGISVLVMIVLLFAGYNLFKKLTWMADEGEDPESAIEYYHDDNGQERWRMKALTRWRMEQ